MIRLPRRFALWGGAAAIAMGGFAFMASNHVDASSAGAGAGKVSGYTVANQSYRITNRCATGTTSPTCTATPYIKGFTFTLTANSATANAKVQPTTVLAYPETNTGGRPWGHTTSCTVTTWNATTGTGTVTCTAAAHPSQAPVATFDRLYVEASQ